MQLSYSSSSPTQNLPIAVEAVIAVLASLAGELLYRGVFFVVLARWVTDRLYEAGAEDNITFPLRVLGTEHTILLTTVQSAQIITTALSAFALVAAAAQKDFSDRGKYEAEVEELRLELAATKSGKPKAAKKAPASSGMDFDDEDDDEPRLFPVSTRAGAYDVQSFSSGVKGTLELSKLLTINSVFIATGGNLAATFAASAANTLVFSLLKRFAAQRQEEVRKGMGKMWQETGRRCDARGAEAEMCDQERYMLHVCEVVFERSGKKSVYRGGKQSCSARQALQIVGLDLQSACLKEASDIILERPICVEECAPAHAHSNYCRACHQSANTNLAP